jgi:adenylate cyclase
VKQCTKCGKRYTDETLNFCLDDGEWLVDQYSAPDPPTVIFPPSTAAKGSAAYASSSKILPTSDDTRSIAVLPFANVSADPDNEYFCDGLAEELLNALSKIEGLRVVARTSAFSFKGKNIDATEIGEALRVDTILEGSVRKSGSKVRVTAQLVNAADGYHLWTERYDRELRDIFDVQDEMTLAIVDSLRLKLLGHGRASVLKRYTENTEAYHLYLRGRFYWNKRSSSAYAQAIEYFEHAIELDPGYALAYSGIADCYNSSGFSLDVGSLPTNEIASRAKSAALKALEIDDTLAEAHTSLAYARQLFDWDWETAEEGFRKAIDLNPNYANAHHWYSHLLVAMKRFAESLVHSRLALEIDPLSVVMNTHLGWHYLYAREYDSAVRQLQNALCIDPEFLHAHWYLALSYEQKEMFSEAEWEFRAALTPTDDTLAIEADAAHFYGVSGQGAKAKSIVLKLERLAEKQYVSSFGLALAHLGLGDTDRTFRYLDRSLRERSDMLVYLEVDPRLEPLRDDPRYVDLARRVGLPVSGRS